MSYFERIGGTAFGQAAGLTGRLPTQPTIVSPNSPPVAPSRRQRRLTRRRTDTLPTVHLEDAEPSSLPLPFRATGLEGASSRTFVDR
jgi:hypothetical protein